MATTWYPIINEDQCVGCGTCVEFCEHDVYIMGDNGKPQVVNHENCVEFCRGCSKICPVEAITYFGDTDA